MSTLKFADTYNMVVFLEKPTEIAGFEQIIDFLNANPIKYALTINPTIYTSRIKQFWATAKVKTVNGEVQLQALVDGKKIIITESIVRRDLQLADENGIECLPNATIFEELTRMEYEKLSEKLTFYKSFFSSQWKIFIHTILQCLSAKTTAWNEFSSTMASAIICLATNKKFNFSKYIFKSMVKNLDNVGKFLMYLKFVQVFLNQQLEGVPTHNRTYIAPFHTKKIFRNMRRVGKGFSRRETPLFQTMVVQDQANMGEDKAVYEKRDDSLVRAATTASSLEAEQDSGNINKTQSKATLNKPSSLGTSSGSGPSGEDSMKLKELMKLCTKLSQRVLDLENIKTSQAVEIAKLKKGVKMLEKKGKSRPHKLKILYKVGSFRRVESYEDEGLGEEDASKQGRNIANIDVGVGINLETRSVVEEVNAVINKATLVSTAEETVNVAAITVSTTSTIPVSTAQTITDVEITLAQALAELKSTKPKAKRIVLRESNEFTTTTTIPIPSILIPSKIQEKGKAKLVKEPKLMKKKHQEMLDQEVALKLQAVFDEEERLAREKG
ncbi:hypothetical protein Tco_0428284 [Tanacetum coccineum]